ncbi:MULTISPECIES: hypothetical protein [unclassified Roseofilum]|uniref:hypothetical protein n=1 Tax=unclassified Roseofilum TaxID=2620099 RepID=UPI000E8FA614|nr:MULTISPECIES: hypothetical protein [unclassified Roseofilum]MBP0010735.1 hypothetical protein [Roseofilum sp. Belize Diploria]HBQ99528.1 hypothetical protein [Cyanobacteria bacterium UBA11691]MBP0014734.1 hypothetical protein [Roseofilum sp. SID3]MBP0025597.1 hypothetical protein [Roseofilum sp. SID2]MBP0032404.1 hypothetical protein [Roseofilum sp. Belize BBD 4]
MSKVYSTEDLIAILAQERQACMRGERLNLNSQLSGHPIIDQFVAVEGVQNFIAYKDFQSTIHQYQREYQVSGIIWQEILIHQQTLHYPTIHDQLIALPQDLDILQQAKSNILNFWHQVTVAMDIFIADGRRYQKITHQDIEPISQRTQWALIYKWENPSYLEIVLQLGWGQPTEASYQRSLPHSGSRSIHAVYPGTHPIG